MSQGVEGLPKQPVNPGWIQTMTGKKFKPMEPNPHDIHILDIAHALSHVCRFTGHTSMFYSVAEHCVRLSYAVSDENALWGLLHDASEAYLCDLAHPLKVRPEFAAYREAEARLMKAVCKRFALPLEQPNEVSVADLRMVATEKRDLFGKEPAEWVSIRDVQPYDWRIVPWPAAVARKRFLLRYQMLMVFRSKAQSTAQKMLAEWEQLKGDPLWGHLELL